MAYKNQCGSCINFDEPKPSPLKKGYCSWYRCYYYPDDTCVGDGDHYRYRGYITTMICDRLGLEKTKEVYKTITDFQKNVMENNKQYEEDLNKYNIIGPKIANCLANEDINIINKIYITFLIPVAKMIKEDHPEQAIFKYKEMVKILKTHYCFDDKTNINDKPKILIRKGM